MASIAKRSVCVIVFGVREVTASDVTLAKRLTLKGVGDVGVRLAIETEVINVGLEALVSCEGCVKEAYTGRKKILFAWSLYVE